MNIIINLSRHVREFPSVPVSMFDEFSRKLLRVHVVRPCLVECRMPVVDAETVFHTDFDFFVPKITDVSVVVWLGFATVFSVKSCQSSFSFQPCGMHSQRSG